MRITAPNPLSDVIHAQKATLIVVPWRKRMKPFLIAAMLMLGTSAVAQDMTQPPTPPAAPAADPAAPPPAADAAAPADPAAPAPMTDPAAPADPAAPPAPPEAAPAPAPMETAQATPQPSTKDYPVCSRTVTDNCVNRRGR